MSDEKEITINVDGEIVLRLDMLDGDAFTLSAQRYGKVVEFDTEVIRNEHKMESAEKTDEECGICYTENVYVKSDGSKYCIKCRKDKRLK